MVDIVYGAVAEEGEIVFEHKVGTGLWEPIVGVLLDRKPEGNHKKSYLHEGYSYNYIATDETTFICVCDHDFSTRIAFGFLSKIAELYELPHTNFDSVLERQMDFFSHDPKADKLRGVRGEVNKVQDIMMENIENVLKRGEKLEDLVSKTDRLQSGAGKFKSASGKLKTKFWWKNVKLCGCIICLLATLVVVVFFVVVAVCGGFSFSSCSM